MPIYDRQTTLFALCFQKFLRLQQFYFLFICDMNQSKRYFFQVLLWFGIWTVVWVLNNTQPRFLFENAPAFVAQVLLLGGLVFYAAPVLLFKKKYGYFVVLSILAIAVCVFFSSLDYMEVAVHRGPPRGLRKPPKGIGIVPSKGFIHFLLLTLSYILATFLETFVFAKKKEEETAKNKNEKLQTELKFLKSQINPHFLFNSLNNIYALSVIDSGKTQESIAYLSDMLRYVLYECEQPLVPLEKEIAYIENYVKLFSLKSSKPYPINLELEVANKGTLVAPMLFIPFVENALKHSNIEKRDNAFIRIKIGSDAGKVYFEIENSLPQQQKVKDAVGGIGIENVQRRLLIQYPDRHDLVVAQTSLSYKVNLSIDLYGKN